MGEKRQSFKNKICLIIKIRIWRFVILQIIHIYLNQSKNY